ncbi:membrane bound O-acyl transferase family-domain-containing protein [Coprinopsis sp. MPI-PUGE-AT-0042]|nr:membrane bound O-acyl transferase family-domain-containing protein [Coprinopsis sp. MPI-PUGE-AT-0042]
MYYPPNAGVLALTALSESLATLSCSFASPIHRRVTFVPFCLLNLFVIFHPQAPKPDILIAWSVSCWLALRVLVLFDYLFLTSDVHQEMKKIPSDGRAPQGDLRSTSFSNRFQWSFDLLSSARGVGWIGGHCQTVNDSLAQTRLGFVRARFRSLLLHLLVSLALCNYLASHPIAHDITLGTFPMRALLSWGRIWEIRCRVQILFDLAAIASVLLGFSGPTGWPTLTGCVTESYTLRRFWGTFWHQLLRRVLTRHSEFYAKVLNLPRGTPRTYFKLFVTFFLSGVIHHAGDYTMRQDWKGYSIQFFTVQAAGITLEDVVIGLGKRWGARRNWLMQSLGYAWVIIWFAYWHPYWIEPQLSAGAK